LETTIEFDCSGVDWAVVAGTLKRVGMGYYEPHVHKKAFENSHTTVFVYHEGNLIGFGRAISDDAYEGALYDVAVVPEFQGKGIGSTIVKSILTRLSHCSLILFAAPGKEGFYEKLGLRKMKTGMALFTNPEAMRKRGFTE
jgi:ribosomal protein S18 acetylase RimI-like enzyme